MEFDRIFCAVLPVVFVVFVFNLPSGFAQEKADSDSSIVDETEIVFKASDYLNELFFDSSKVKGREPDLMNAALDGIVRLLKTKGVDFVPRKVKKGVSKEIARHLFKNEFNRACKAASGISRRRAALAATDAMLDSLDDSHTHLLQIKSFKDLAKMEKLAQQQKVKSKIIKRNGKRVGYIKISNFLDLTGWEFIKNFGKMIFPSLDEVENIFKNMRRLGNSLKALVNANVDAVVLDLRGNPGGALSFLYVVLSCFLEGEADLWQMYRDQAMKFRGVIPVNSGIIKIKSLPKVLIQIISLGFLPQTSLPLAVLVDNESSSVSEVVVGALKYHKRAVVIGSRTAGKCNAATIVRLPHKTAMMVSIFELKTPDGTVIEGNGIEPDIKVKPGSELKKALEILTGGN